MILSNSGVSLTAHILEEIQFKVYYLMGMFNQNCTESMALIEPEFAHTQTCIIICTFSFCCTRA